MTDGGMDKADSTMPPPCREAQNIASSSAAAATVRPPVLPYGQVKRRSIKAAIDQPISHPFAIALFLIATWPFLLYAASPTLLYMRPVCHIVCGGVTVASAIAAYGIRSLIVPPVEVHTDAGRESALRRLRITAFCILGYLATHATGLPLLTLFLMHKPLFEAAADRAQQTLAPGARAPHARIGLFNVTAVARGVDGEVGFSIGDDPIYRDPTPATPDCLFYPPGNGGRLVGNWYWEATD